MNTILAVGAGSFIGGVLRYLISQFIQLKSSTSFPFGTLGVNILGCFLIGIVFTLSSRGSISQEWKFFIATGILGGFTTFSAFASESLTLFREGQFGLAAAYIASSVILGLLATFIGISAIKLF